MSLFVCKQQIIFEPAFTPLEGLACVQKREPLRKMELRSAYLGSSLYWNIEWIKFLHSKSTWTLIKIKEVSFIFNLSAEIKDKHASTSPTIIWKLTYPPWHKRCCQHLLLWWWDFHRHIERDTCSQRSHEFACSPGSSWNRCRVWLILLFGAIYKRINFCYKILKRFQFESVCI